MTDESSPNIKFLFTVAEIFIPKQDFGDVKPVGRMEGETMGRIPNREDEGTDQAFNCLLYNWTAFS
jgi:hypothetical protein